jgi:hypothetical protein
MSHTPELPSESPLMAPFPPAASSVDARRRRLRGRRLSAGLAARRDDAARRLSFTTPLRNAHPGAAAHHVSDFTRRTP